MSAFGQEGDVFSISCSTGGFLLDLLNVIVPENHFLASFTDCQPSRHSEYNVTLTECQVGPRRSSREKKRRVFVGQLNEAYAPVLNMLYKQPISICLARQIVDTDNLTRQAASSEIIPTRCNSCVYSSQWLYSTCFG